jgi:hypothetical protein
MEENDARQALVREGLSGYLLAVNAVKAFEQQIQGIAQRVLMSRVQKIKDAGCYVEPPVIWPHQEEVNDAIALGFGLRTCTSEKDGELRWSGIYSGVSWVRTDGDLAGFKACACCELRVESGGRRDSLFTSLSKASAGDNLMSESAVLTKLNTQNGTQIRMPLSSDSSPGRVEEQLGEAIESMTVLLAAAGGLRKAVLGR